MCITLGVCICMYRYIHTHMYMCVFAYPFINITLTTEGFKVLLEIVPSSLQAHLAQPPPSPPHCNFSKEILSQAHFNNQFKTNIGPPRIINYNRVFSKGYSEFKNIDGFPASGMLWLTFLMHHISLTKATSRILV